ncbi:MAG TPA: plasmid stabilization protein [Bacteroidetes bacterium]|nr:plasmid stabilization protein [Bacteroidota bacterium]
MKLVLHSKASHELEDITEWYENKEPGLGADFILDFEISLQTIKRHPESGTPLTPNERRFSLSKFPYGIIYSLDIDGIIVFAIMHIKRKPDYWSSRKEI